MSHGLAESRTCWFSATVPAARYQVDVGRNEAPNGERTQPVSTLFIYYNGDAHLNSGRLGGNNPLRSVLSRLNGFHRGRRNPRSLSYMKEIVDSRLGSIGWTSANDSSVLPTLHQFEQIILLWPDGNGMGWFNIERQVFNGKRVSAPVYVLNGRKRLFELQRPLWRGYRFRRFLEKSFLLELGVLVVFLVTAPLLLFWDTTFGSREAGD